MGALGVGEDASVGEFPVEKGKVRDEECLAVVPKRLLDRAGENARAQSAPNSLRCPREGFGGLGKEGTAPSRGLGPDAGRAWSEPPRRRQRARRDR
jgi:hypothetical protein